MTLTDVEVDLIRREQTANWDAVSTGWRRWQAEFEAGAGVVSRRLVELAGLRVGQAVLDFGTGLGEPALTAARAVGPTGHVEGVDLSPAMIAQARLAAGAAGNVRFSVGDVAAAAVPPGGFDAVLSRWSLMFTTDRVATLRALAGVLRPGGALAAAVWGPPASVPMIGLGFAAISRHLRLDPPPPGRPGPFTMADPDQLAAEVTAAGLTDVAVQEQAVPFVMPSPDVFAQFTRDVLPPAMHATIAARCTIVQTAALWRWVAAAATPRVRADGVVDLTSTALCVRAVA